MMMNFTFLKKNAHAVPLASARQHPENQNENQAGHSSERAVEGPLGESEITLGSQQPGSCRCLLAAAPQRPPAFFWHGGVNRAQRRRWRPPLRRRPRITPDDDDELNLNPPTPCQ